MPDFEDIFASSNPCIMVIDDDPNTVRGLVRLLENEGYDHVISVTDPRQAVEQFSAASPDLVLLDWHMEDLTGLQVLQAFRDEFPQGGMPPIIVLTGDTFPEAKHQALEAGASDFLTKPWDASEVCLRIQYHLRLRQLHQHVQMENQRLEELVHIRTAKLRKTLSELQQVQQQVIAEERMRSLSVMAGGVAHDFNNSLSIIRGYSELYSDFLGTKATPEEMRKAFGIIALASHDAGKIVHRLRDFYRPFSEKTDAFSKVNLNKLIEESTEMAGPKWKTQCQANGICIAVETDFQEIPMITVVSTELREAVINLIFNAVDAMPQGGRIVIRTRQVESDVIIEIEDNGTGMTPETRGRCLEPFYSTKGEKGTGLGLAVTYGIIKRHDGRIEIRTELNRGTCFSIILPLHSERDAHPENITRLPLLRHLRILLVDDDPYIRMVMALLLQEDEHSVTVAGNGCEALEKFNGGEFDLVITDRVMPKMSGDQLAVALREIGTPKPIIMLTGFEGRAAAKEVDLVLPKPAGMNSIREAISRVMMVEFHLDNAKPNTELQLRAS